MLRRVYYPVNAIARGDRNHAAGLAAAPGVDGSVTQKFVRTDDSSYLIAVDGAPYEVPLDLYLRVNVGNTVHFDGANWTIAGR